MIFNYVKTKMSGGREHIDLIFPENVVQKITLKCKFGDNAYSFSEIFLGTEQQWYIIDQLNEVRCPFSWEPFNDIKIPQVIVKPRKKEPTIL